MHYFAITAIVSLALGIGATTAVFSVVYAVLMNPYPYRDSERLAYLIMRDKAGNDRGAPYNADQVRQLRQVEALDGVIAMNDWSLTTTEGDLCGRCGEPFGRVYGQRPGLGPGIANRQRTRRIIHQFKAIGSDRQRRGLFFDNRHGTDRQLLIAPCDY